MSKLALFGRLILCTKLQLLHPRYLGHVTGFDETGISSGCRVAGSSHERLSLDEARACHIHIECQSVILRVVCVHKSRSLIESFSYS